MKKIQRKPALFSVLLPVAKQRKYEQFLNFRKKYLQSLLLHSIIDVFLRIFYEREVRTWTVVVYLQMIRYSYVARKNAANSCLCADFIFVPI